jgi:O-antigen/teichoic acid export membrane protein
MSRRRRFVKDSVASVLRTSSGAFLVLLVPPVLIRQLGPTTYGAWAIAVELGTYLGLLDLGALSAVGHFAARHGDGREGDSRVMSTMVAFQVALVTLGALVLAAVVTWLPAIYPGLPDHLVPGARLTLALVGASSLVGLLATAFTGYFLTVGRLVIPSTLTFASRLIGTGLVIVLASAGLGVEPLAFAWAGASLAGYVLIAVAFGRLKVPLRRSRVDRGLVREMVRFSGAHSVWIAGGLLVVGLDTTIVARLDFDAVAPFAVAAGAVTILIAVYSSSLAPLVPVSAELTGRGERQQLTELLVRVTRLGAAVVVLGTAALALAADPLLTLWVGPEVARPAAPLLRALVAANAVRLVVMPYPVLLFGTGEHRRVRSTPLVEGTVNVVASVLLGLAIGPVGVALGTLVGALTGLALHVGVNVPRTRSLDLDAATFARRALARPLAAGLPVVGVVLLHGVVDGALWWGLAAGSLTTAIVLTWSTVLLPTERAAVLARLRRRDDVVIDLDLPTTRGDGPSPAAGPEPLGPQPLGDARRIPDPVAS